MKNRKFILGLSLLAVGGAAASSCNSSVTHPLNCDIKEYSADLNHDGKLGDYEVLGKTYHETNLSWEDAYDSLMSEANSTYLLNAIADELNIAEDEERRCSLARYEILHEAEELLMSTSAVVPIYNYADPYLLKDNIKNLYATDLGYKFFDRLVDTSNPSKKDFAVSVGTRAETFDPATNTDASTANILCAALMGAKRWVIDEDSPIATETDPNRGLYNAKLENGCCKVTKNIVTSDKEKAKLEGYVSYDELDDLPKGSEDEYEGTARYTIRVYNNEINNDVEPALWNDGTQITAEDFIYEWNRASSAVYNDVAQGMWVSLFDSIRGYETWTTIGQQDDRDPEKWSESTIKTLNALKESKGEEYVNSLIKDWQTVWDRNEEAKSNKKIDCEGRDGGMLGIVRKDKFTFDVQLVNDSEYFQELLAFPAYLPVRKTNVYTDRVNHKENLTWCWNENETYSTNSTLQFKGVLPRDESQPLKLVKNEYAIGYDPNVNVNSITFNLIDDDTNMYNQFCQKDGLVMIDAIAAGVIDKVKAQSVWHLAPQIGMFYYIFNVNDNTFDIKNGLSEKDREKFRRIMVLLMNRYDICENIAKSGVTSANGFVSTNIVEKCYPVWDESKGKYVAARDGKGNLLTCDWHCRNTDMSQYLDDKGTYVEHRMANRNCKDVKESKGFYSVAYSKDQEQTAMKENMKEAYKLAKELESTAGLIVKGTEDDFTFENFPSITISTNSGTSLEALAERIQAYYSLYNISCTIETQEWQSFSNTRTSGDYAFARHGWVADYNDPRTYLDLVRSTDGNNDTQLGKSGDSVHIHKSR